MISFAYSESVFGPNLWVYLCPTPRLRQDVCPYEEVNATYRTATSQLKADDGETLAARDPRHSAGTPPPRLRPATTSRTIDAKTIFFRHADTSPEECIRGKPSASHGILS